jgi:hypothetical protein
MPQSGSFASPGSIVVSCEWLVAPGRRRLLNHAFWWLLRRRKEMTTIAPVSNTATAPTFSPPITGTGKRAIAADGSDGMAKCFSDFFVCTDIMFADLFLEQMALFRWIVPSIRRILSCDQANLRRLYIKSELLFFTSH